MRRAATSRSAVKILADGAAESDDSAIAKRAGGVELPMNMQIDTNEANGSKSTEAAFFSFPGYFAGPTRCMPRVTTPESSMGIAASSLPDVSIGTTIFSSQTERRISVPLTTCIDVRVTEPEQTLF